MVLRRTLGGGTFAGHTFDSRTLTGRALAQDIVATFATHRTAVNQALGYGNDYPFVIAHIASDIFVDFYVSAPDSEAYPFKLAEAYGFGTIGAAPPAHANVRDVIVTDRDDNVIVDTGAGSTFSEQIWGSRTVTSWTAASVVVTAVWHAGASMAFPDDWTVDADLDPRTCNPLPRRVTSIRIGGSTISLNGRVSLANGFNTVWKQGPTVTSDGSRRTTRLTFSAAAGSGRGIFSNCAEIVPTPTVQSINSIKPGKGGQFHFEVGGCHRLRLPSTLDPDGGTGYIAHIAAPLVDPPTLEQASSAWQFVNDCKPCARCEEFEATHEGVLQVFQQWWRVGSAPEPADSALTVSTEYHRNRARWLAAQACRHLLPVRLAIYPQPNCRVSVSSLFCNKAMCCLSPVELRFTLRRFLKEVPSTSTETGSTYDGVISGPNYNGDEVYNLGGAWPVYRAKVAGLTSGQSVAVRFRICTACITDESLQIALTVHAAAVVDPGFPPVVVPQAIKDLWTAAGLPTDTSALAQVRALEIRGALLNTSKRGGICECP